MTHLEEIMTSDSKSKGAQCFILNKFVSSATEEAFVLWAPWTQAGVNVIYNIDDHFFLSNEHKKINYVEIPYLINFNYSLKKPVVVKIIQDINGDVIGDIEELELYSYGNDESEVLRELNEDLTDLFERLITMGNDRLGKHPKKWKKILKQYIEIS